MFDQNVQITAIFYKDKSKHFHKTPDYAKILSSLFCLLLKLKLSDLSSSNLQVA